MRLSNVFDMTQAKDLIHQSGFRIVNHLSLKEPYLIDFLVERKTLETYVSQFDDHDK